MQSFAVSVLAIYAGYIQSIGSGIDICSQLFYETLISLQVTLTSQSIETILSLVVALILMPCSLLESSAELQSFAVSV